MLRAKTSKAHLGGKDINVPAPPPGPIADRRWVALATRIRGRVEIIAAEIKKGLDEVEQYRQGLKELGSVEDFIGKLKSGN